LNHYAVIMAGGRGERFWPKSRKELPKQFLPLVEEKSLLQQSYERVLDFVDQRNILIVTGREHLDLARAQLPHLPKANFLAEPQGRNTAPCIGLAAIHICKRDPKAVMLVFPADHLVQGREDFIRSMTRALKLASNTDNLVTIGIIPTRPETGYGYIEREDNPFPGAPPAYLVHRFVEKPVYQNALQYLRSGKYLWNSGIFAWKASLILEKMQKHLPDLYQGLMEISAHLGCEEEEDVLNRIFPTLPHISIDYGILEKETDLVVVQGDFGWDDLGSWSALAECFPKDGTKTVSMGQHVGIDTTDCLVYGRDALIATLGVENLVIVQEKDVVLVCSKNRTQEVKNLVLKIKEQDLEKYL
jgi:mannose-1-phosphate guanylyltransferase